MTYNVFSGTLNPTQSIMCVFISLCTDAVHKSAQNSSPDNHHSSDDVARGLCSSHRPL